MTTKYDVQISNTIRSGLSYAELIMLPIEPDTYLRRGHADWIQAIDCVELTHVLANRPQPVTVCQDADDHYYEDEPIEDEVAEFASMDEDFEYQECDASQYQDDTPEDDMEERIFIPTEEYFKCKQKRKAAIIGVCTLGLAGLSLIGIGNTWRSNIFAGTSFSANAGIGFVLKCLSFCLLTAFIAIPYFIYSVFALIYYSIRINSLER